MRCIRPEVKRRIVEVLKSGERVSGETLAKLLGISRVSVWKHVKTLISLGYEIEAGGSGYRLIKVPDEPFPWELGVNYLYCPKVKSTMDVAWRYFGIYDGVIAREQTRGRGKTSSWLSLPGGLYLSTCITGVTSISSILESVSRELARTLSKEYMLEIEAKEGKLFLEGKKVGGLLIEVRGNDRAVLGIGINVRNPIPEGSARLEGASLREVAGIVIRVLQRYIQRERA
ncbi:related biotin operon repressor/biotin--[acetyl CoA carboxylase] ligase [Pyrococcus sp. NA2]|uniref:HTH domain-containing protein n=1 Tax=Pyrococcus sp. (strain NA2) TaxID=342949 RepID=UPI000209AD47|nr:HTH domain-containing protein [Pyrococcus sp. NA2]AEC51611.1 related biotin operon repressor/biotin--[acetyl CoA carboxylase] ligase [Pyrococcus sp. NA2]